jgi:hypothetical protein
MDGDAGAEDRGSFAVEQGNDGESWLVRKNGVERAQRRREEEICFAARRKGTEHADA